MCGDTLNLKRVLKSTVLHLPAIVCTVTIIALLLIKPVIASNGIKSGLNLLLTTIIPSLFPFLVVSSYIASSKSFSLLSRFFERSTKAVFKLSGDAFIPILMGVLGGYPVGAKITADLYKAQRLTQNEAERLMYFTVNSGPAFTVTAVGVSMLNSYYSGLILFCSCILTSLTIGFFCRFLSDDKIIKNTPELNNDKTLAFINSVSSGANAIINISAWVLTFSCASALINQFSLNHNLELFLNAVLEVTNGCSLCAKSTSLPVISAVLGFGSFSVICQISPFFTLCGVKLKNFIASRILNAALSAFFTSQLLKLFPQAAETAIIYTTKNNTIGVSYTISATIILLIMCVFFILQVDNRKKVC